MTREEAIQALEQGHKLTHTLFTKEEWVQQLDTVHYIFEDDIVCLKSEFWYYRNSQDWQINWSVYHA